MSHKSVRTFIEDTAKSLRDDVQYTYARTSDFNVMRDKKYPFITLDPLSASPQFATDGTFNFMKGWNCSMAFYEMDKEGSDQDQYALILDETSELVDKFLNKLNTYSYESDTILIQSIVQTPFVKATADILTGYLLSFVILAQDDFDYCAVDCQVTSNEC